MNIKEAISKELSKLPKEQLALLYEQINSIKTKSDSKKNRRSRYSIEDIHRMTSSSDQQWSEDVIESRDERL